jgi:hypothetical protein
MKMKMICLIVMLLVTMCGAAALDEQILQQYTDQNDDLIIGYYEQYLYESAIEMNISQSFNITKVQILLNNIVMTDEPPANLTVKMTYENGSLFSSSSLESIEYSTLNETEWNTFFFSQPFIMSSGSYRLLVTTLQTETVKDYDYYRIGSNYPGGDIAQFRGVNGIFSPTVYHVNYKVFYDNSTVFSSFPACNNSIDDDNDTFTDWPADAGCVDALDDNETDPVTNTGPYNLSLCGNVILYHTFNLSCQASAVDFENDVLTYHVNDSRLSINASGHISDDPVITDHSTAGWNVSVNVTDGEYWYEASFLYTVLDHAPVISIDSHHPLQPVPGDNVTVHISVADQDGDMTDLTWTWYVAGVQHDTGLFGGLVNGSAVNVTLAGDAYVQGQALRLSLLLNDSVLYDSEELTVRQGTPLRSGVCPGTLTDSANLFIIMVLIMFLVVLGFKASIIGIVGSLALMFVGFILAGCHAMLGMMVAVTAILLFFYFAISE